MEKERRSFDHPTFGVIPLDSMGGVLDFVEDSLRTTGLYYELVRQTNAKYVKAYRTYNKGEDSSKYTHIIEHRMKKNRERFSLIIKEKIDSVNGSYSSEVFITQMDGENGIFSLSTVIQLGKIYNSMTDEMPLELNSTMDALIKSAHKKVNQKSLNELLTELEVIA